jgi:hypothetical protein
MNQKVIVLCQLLVVDLEDVSATSSLSVCPHVVGIVFAALNYSAIERLVHRRKDIPTLSSDRVLRRNISKTHDSDRVLVCFLHSVARGDHAILAYLTFKFR